MERELVVRLCALIEGSILLTHCFFRLHTIFVLSIAINKRTRTTCEAQKYYGQGCHADACLCVPAFSKGTRATWY
jgi:hypothetical protein